MVARFLVHVRGEGDEYVINGHKWYTTNATDPRCRIAIFMGKTDPDNPNRHRQQSMILESMCRRGLSRVAFGQPIIKHGVWSERIAESRLLIEQARLLTLQTAHMMDTVGNVQPKGQIAMIKVAAPAMACKVIDWAIQAHGGGGTSNDWGLAGFYATARLLRLADGPDEVHRNQIAKLELAKYDQRTARAPS